MRNSEGEGEISRDGNGKLGARLLWRGADDDLFTGDDLPGNT